MDFNQLSNSMVLVVGLIIVGIVGLLLPRLLVRLRTLFRVSRGLEGTSLSSQASKSCVTAYHDRLANAERLNEIDAATWGDLDLETLFLSVDRTKSQPGGQYLYHRLRTPGFDTNSFINLERAVKRFADDNDTATVVRTALRRLDDPRAAQLVTLLFGDLPTRPRLWWVFPGLSIGSFSSLALAAFWPPAIVLLLAICIANIFVQILYRPRVKAFIAAYHEVPAFLSVARQLGKLQVDELSDILETLRENEATLGLLRRATSWLVFEPGQSHEVASTIYEYVNLLFLFDINAFVFGTEAIRNSRPQLRNMFDAVGYVDFTQSVASWRDSLSGWCVPEFTEPSKMLRAESVTHPLLANAVANTIVIDSSSVLITGSNMAGKTTFVRTLGVNAVLAQTVHTVCASSWRAPLLRVRSSINRSDSLIGGKSHYFAEAESVLGLIRAKEDGHQNLFLIDEFFRGTNTAERIAAGFAVLSFLNRGLDIVVVATHDIEVLDRLKDAYEPYHFREHISDEGLEFDFILRRGRSSTRNAIALLRQMQYPTAVLVDASSALEPS